MTIKQIWANLAVSDLSRTTKFYTEIGFEPNGLPSAEITSFRAGMQAFVLNFIRHDTLGPAMKGPLADPAKGNEIIFTLSADSPEEVNKWALEIQKAGGTLVSEPEVYGDDYYGFVFADPDGHRFNVFLYR